MPSRSKTWATEILCHPLWLAITDALLTSRTKSYTGDEIHECISKPQISSSALLCIGPGAKAQGLHRDGMLHHDNHSKITADEYPIGRDSSIAMFVASTRTTKENGATRFQPGSHLQASLEPPVEADAVYAELEPGDAFIMLASCYHGGSANTTKDEERRVYSMHFTKGYLRQEENQYLAISRERILELPEQAQKKLGYEMSAPFVGWVDLVDPLAFIKGEKVQAGDVF
ncbi:PhyH-domain-containing protein [Microthyrium microscopicum]|uniref:PhyH-domain-containing protein n=1 Tax=Microthyrium microscopicum TaxID=703497 RepID=A0A6A6UJM4_9PEZI|nr:PhyH-domain-containing protein [Microthyrium microscopicum]